MKSSKFLLVAVIGLLVFASAGQSAYAGTLTLKLIDLGTGANTTVVDLGGTGMVVFNGVVGNFIVNVTTGLSKPILGGGNVAKMDLSSVNVSCLGGTCPGPVPDTLRILLSDKNFSPNSDGGLFTGNVGGTLASGASAVFKAWMSSTNTLFAAGGPTLTLGTFNTVAFSGSSSTFVAPTQTYSMTLQADLKNPAGTKSDSFDFEVNAPTPEPGTIALLGAGLLLLGVGARRRQSSLGA